MENDQILTVQDDVPVETLADTVIAPKSSTIQSTTASGVNPAPEQLTTPIQQTTTDKVAVKSEFFTQLEPIFESLQNDYFND